MLRFIATWWRVYALGFVLGGLILFVGPFVKWVVGPERPTTRILLNEGDQPILLVEEQKASQSEGSTRAAISDRVLRTLASFQANDLDDGAAALKTAEKIRDDSEKDATIKFIVGHISQKNPVRAREIALAKMHSAFSKAEALLQIAKNQKDSKDEEVAKAAQTTAQEAFQMVCDATPGFLGRIFDYIFTYIPSALGFGFWFAVIVALLHGIGHGIGHGISETYLRHPTAPQVRGPYRLQADQIAPEPSAPALPVPEKANAEPPVATVGERRADS